MMRVKKNDTVIVLNGKDKGKRGLVIDILPKKGKVKVQGIAIVTHHVKKKKQGDVSMIKKEESFIDLSNVMPVCGSSNMPTRVNFSIAESGVKARISNATKETF